MKIRTLALFIILIFSLSSLYSQDVFLLENKNFCIRDFWYKSNKFYYVRADNNNTYYSSTKSFQHKIFSGFDYNSSSGVCSPKITPFKLGIDYHQYTFLMGLLGLLLGAGFTQGIIYIFSRR